MVLKLLLQSTPLSHGPFSSAPISDVVFQRICDCLKDVTHQLISHAEKHGWQFGAMHAQAEQFERFWVDDEMARQMVAISPRLWHFIGSLLSSKYSADDFLDMNISDLNDVDNLGVSESQDLGDMIEELIEDKPTREAQKIANEKAIIALVLFIFRMRDFY